MSSPPRLPSSRQLPVSPASPVITSPSRSSRRHTPHTSARPDAAAVSCRCLRRRQCRRRRHPCRRLLLLRALTVLSGTRMDALCDLSAPASAGPSSPFSHLQLAALAAAAEHRARELARLLAQCRFGRVWRRRRRRWRRRERRRRGAAVARTTRTVRGAELLGGFRCRPAPRPRRSRFSVESRSSIDAGGDEVPGRALRTSAAQGQGGRRDLSDGWMLVEDALVTSIACTPPPMARRRCGRRWLKPEAPLPAQRHARGAVHTRSAGTLDGGRG